MLPRDCPPLSLCAAGAERYFSFTGPVFLVCVLTTLALLHWLLGRGTPRKRPRGTAAARSGGKLADDSPASADSSSSPTANLLPSLTMSRASDAESLGAPLLHRQQNARPVSLRFERLSASVLTASGRKRIMQDVSGQFVSGRVTAIMGPSGAGKSTLMRLLTGKVSLDAGTIFVNNQVRDCAVLRR